MLCSVGCVVAVLAAPSRASSFTASAAVAPVSHSPSFGPIRSHAVVSGSLGETIASAAVVIVSLAVDIVRGQAGHA